MILCPHCHNQELEGSLFCSECGNALRPQGDPPGAAVAEANEDSSAPPAAAGLRIDSSVGTGVALNLINSDEILMLGNRSEFTLGRVSDGQPVRPDIDLTPYQAYEQGVSRLHASLRVQRGQVTVVDLGSANGTRVNGKKIYPHAPHILKNGDVLTLGKLKIEVLVQNT